MNEKLSNALKFKLSEPLKWPSVSEKSISSAFTLGPFNHKENIPLKFKKSEAAESSVPHVFKAKPMPNFNVIHKKLTLNTAQSVTDSSKSFSHVRPKNLVSGKKTFAP